MKTFTTVKAKHGNLNHGHHDTGEPGAVISRTPGSEGGRRKRTNLTGTSSAAYPTLRTDLWEPGGEPPPGHPTDAQPDPTRNA
jgi:hypothetical protein